MVSMLRRSVHTPRTVPRWTWCRFVHCVSSCLMLVFEIPSLTTRKSLGSGSPRALKAFLILLCRNAEIFLNGATHDDSPASSRQGFGLRRLAPTKRYRVDLETPPTLAIAALDRRIALELPPTRVNAEATIRRTRRARLDVDGLRRSGWRGMTVFRRRPYHFRQATWTTVRGCFARPSTDDTEYSCIALAGYDPPMQSSLARIRDSLPAAGIATCPDLP